MILIGLDPGKHTGFAVWCTKAQRFSQIEELSIHEALESVRVIRNGYAPRSLLVVWEDARLRKLFGKMDAKQEKYGAAIREGAGAAKRDAQIWADFLADLRIPNIPKKPHKTKQSHEQFARMLAIADREQFKRTNEHARDAAMLVCQTNEPTAQGMLRVWEQSRQKVS